MYTTLNKIKALSPCADGWKKLLKHLGKSSADDEPLAITTILDSNGLSDALWCLRAVDGHARKIRLYAVWCARQVQHLMHDPRSLQALDVAERYAHGQATDGELEAALKAAREAVKKAAREARQARQVAWGPAWGAAWAAWGAACGAACGAAWEAARGAAWEAARGTAWQAQEAELRRICTNPHPKGVLA